ncbi:hypothetical protein OFM21_33650, partial [Escherichia coli]|nr:hypothetical protein [Escherichia coli]
SDRKELQNDILVQNPVWKYKFFVQRRAIKRYKTPEDLAGVNRQEIDEAIRELRFKAFDDTLRFDEELAIAAMAIRLADA